MNVSSYKKTVSWKGSMASWTRWLHIYLSLFSFIIVLFFAVTGLTLNHTDWFPDSTKITERDGKLNTLWVNQSDTAKINKLAIVEFLRSKEKIQGMVNDFRVEDSEISISFQGPGYTADVFIDRQLGSFHLAETRMGVVAVVNDLHKGRDTGKSWSWVIDFSAIFMTVISLSGLILLLFLKKRRTNGLIWAFLGGIVSYLIYYLM